MSANSRQGDQRHAERSRYYGRTTSGDHDNRAAETRPAPARISLIYESRDGKLCLFQDAQGHLTAVRASRLA